MLLIEQEKWGSPYRPSAQQLLYHNETEPAFVHGGDVELLLKIDGTEELLSGATLITVLGSDSRISLPDRPCPSHFTLIAGGNAYLDGVPMSRPIRRLMAWDVQHLLSHLGSAREQLPDQDSRAKTFQELLVKFFIERLGVNRGGKRRERLHGAVRDAKRIAGSDYMDELSAATTALTADEKFWRGISSRTPPWRFLSVAGQPAEFTVHAGNDTLPGHLAERVFTDLADSDHESVWRRDETGKKHHEPLPGESDLETADVTETDGLAQGVLNRLEHEEVLGILQAIPDFDLFAMREQGLTQAQIAERKGVSQARVSQRMKQFKSAARDRFPSFRLE